MQEWVFDRDGARTGRAPGATAVQPLPDPPAPAAPRPPRLGRRGRWTVAAGAALAVLTGGVAVAATSQDTAPAAAAAEAPAAASVPQVPRAVPRTEALPDPGTTEDRTTEDGTAQDGTTEEGTTEDDAASAPPAPWSAMHEERQVQQRDGTTLTVALQGGTVTELTTDSVTVESSDGFTRTYAVTSSTRIGTPSGTLADLAAGDAVLVEATVEGDTATAVTIRTAAPTGAGGTPDTAGGTEQSSSGAEA